MHWTTCLSKAIYLPLKARTQSTCWTPWAANRSFSSFVASRSNWVDMAQCLQRCGSVCLRGHLFMAIFYLEGGKKTDPTKSPKMWHFFCFCGNLGGSIFLDRQKWKIETHYQLETLFGYKTSVPIIVSWALVGNTHPKQCQVITSDDGNINRFFMFSTVS